MSVLSSVQIHWFPGHMKKALNEIEDKIKVVDIVVELIDSRIPFSSLNPYFESRIKNKPKMLVLTKADLADENLLKLTYEIAEEINALIKAYRESYVDEVEDIFVSAGACIKVRNNTVFLFVQKDELAKLNVEGKNDYMLSLARRSAFDGSSTNIPTVDDSVTGFVIDKIHFDGVSGNINTDADVADAIQVLVTNNDLLQFIIYSEVHLTEEDLEDMHYASFDQWNYPTRTVVSVKRENINMEAIKELIKRSDVTSVHIGALLVPLPDDVVDEPAVDG